jgi:hypothetical protein
MKIKIDIKGLEKVELSEKQARELYQKLHEMFGKTPDEPYKITWWDTTTTTNEPHIYDSAVTKSNNGDRA